jgi:NAD(P) transhydrogenase subunit alpha
VREIPCKATSYSLLSTQLVLGVPKEVLPGEGRVSITPQVALKLLRKGFNVLVESGAGTESGFIDQAYMRAGATIGTTQQVWETSNIIVKVRQPAFNPRLNAHEADILKNTQILASYVYPGQNPDLVEKLKAHPQLTVLAHDCVPRITTAQKLDTLSSMAGLAGYRAVIEALQHYPKDPKLRITAAGKVQESFVELNLDLSF